MSAPVITKRTPQTKRKRKAARPAGPDPRVAYNTLPPLPPKAELETPALLKLVIEARAALAEQKSADRLIPDSSVLINLLPILEAQASSEIENIVTTNDELFREASIDEERADPAPKEALRYRTALRHGFECLDKRPLNTSTATEICTIIKGVDMQVRSMPGTVLANPVTREAIYTPPDDPDRLRDLLRNWEAFANASDTDLDPVVRMAVLHYQFEAIHPFADGNGRTGRILNVLLLIQEGLLDMPTLYLSRYLLATRAEYYQRLASVTRSGDWQPWLAYIVKGVAETARWTNGKVTSILELTQHTSVHVQAELPKIYSHELVQLLFRQPYVRIANLVETDIAKRQTASVYLKKLVDIGLLEEEQSGRDKIFVHRKYLDLLLAEHHEFAPYRQRGA